MKVPGAINIADLQLEVERAFGVPLMLPPPVEHGFPDWIVLSRVVAALAVASGARVVGISGSQGSGKSSLAQVLEATLGKAGVAAAACSIDDFYLTRRQRAQLAHEVHPLLQTRGVPGTHDSTWLAEVLTAVHSGRRRLPLPRFDKGLDDRAGTINRDVDALILEGWCVGVRPQPEEMLDQPCNELERSEDPRGIWRRWVNEQIAQRYVPLWAQIDLWIHLRVPSFEQVIQWRSEQERALAEAQRMSASELMRFVQHYERLTRWQWHSEAAGPGLGVVLNAAHGVSEITVSSSDTVAV